MIWVNIIHSIESTISVKIGIISNFSSNVHDITTFPGGITSDGWVFPSDVTWTVEDSIFTTELNSVVVFLVDETIVDFTSINRSVLVEITFINE